MTAPTNVMEPDPVRANTTPAVLQKIDSTIEERVKFYATQSKQVISRRIQELEQEWDMERYLERNAASIALGALTLGLVGKKRWLFFSAGVMSFLLMHTVKGWCPPVPVLRRLGKRTRTEIDREKFALKMLRGDFQHLSTNPEQLKSMPSDSLLQAIQA